ncbi:MAG TPA: carbohydrate ABC transporter permease [Anaerolineales bacterium]|nr:carbohydrate ABC transporter permease [Anaerolineales bacterium]
MFSRKWTYQLFARRFSTFLKHLFLVSIALFSLAPLLWLISIAFRPVEETYVIPMKLFPSTLTLENARLVIEMLPKLIMFYRNSFIITGSSVFLILMISSISGYVFARMKFPGRDFFFWLVVVSMFLPKSMSIPGLYEVLQKMRLIDTTTGLTLAYTGWFLSLSLYIMRNSFSAIPKDLEDAAVVDGCSPLRLYWQIMMPLVAPALVTVAILSFVPIWGEYLYAFTFATTLKSMPMSIGIQLLKPSPASGEWTFSVASMAILISFIPPLLAYFGLQRWFTKGLMEGALKF